MDKLKSSKLARELEPLQARIDALNANRLTLEQELQRIEADLAALVSEKPRYDALQDVCNALGKLADQGAAELFWNELPGGTDPEKSLERLCRIPGLYQQKIDSTLEKKEAVSAELRSCRDELLHLEGEVDDAYLREQKRRDEFVVERDIPFFPIHAAVMPWSKDTESERYFRRAVLIALLISTLLGGTVPLVNVPLPDQADEVAVIPDRIAKLVKIPPAIPEPPPVPKEVKEEQKPADEQKPEKQETETKEDVKVEETARQKVQGTGVLAFKETFKDLIVDAPTAGSGNKARITKKSSQPAGKSLSGPSLVAMQATGTSGGINASAISTTVGTGEEGGSGEQIGSVDFSRVESSVASAEEQVERPSVSSPAPARTDEEIQIVFDRYKAALYRIYNRQLRKNPALRGNILLRLTIEPSGEVSACSVESTDLASPELVKKIVARVLKFNFGPKKEAGKITILYPIDFLPAR